MAYQDPYYNTGDEPYRQRFNEHLNSYYSQETYPTYDQGAYMDSDTYNRPAVAAPNRQNSGVSRRPTGGKERPYADEGFIPPSSEPKVAGTFREWRRDHRQSLWTQGGCLRSCGRFTCCVTMMVVFLAVSILLTLGIYLRPPNIVFNGAGLETDGSPFNVTADSITIGLNLSLSVFNPNFFAILVNDVDVQLMYPINNTNVGSGELGRINFPPHSETNISFPLDLSYNTSDDPNLTVLKDLLSRCGIPNSSTKESITVDYKLTVDLRALIVNLSPTVSNSFSFDCPFDENDVAELLKGVGLNIGDIPGL